MKQIASILAVGLVSSAPAIASTSSFTSSAGFMSASTYLTTLDFNSTPPGYYGTPGALTQDGLTIRVNDNMFIQNTDAYGTGAFLTAQGATPTVIDYTFSHPLSALGFLYETGLDFTLTENGLSVAFSGTNYPQTGYAGIVSSIKFRTAEIVTTAAGIDLDNISFGEAAAVSSAPEPSTWAIMIVGIGGIGMMLRRREKRMGFRLKDTLSA
jgi:hypothetical protein